MLVDTQTKEIDPLIDKLTTERKVAFDYQQRRHLQWDDNYTLYRDFVHINRLIQRQAVNIPLMKETVKTLLAEIDEAPDIYFKNLDNNLEAEYVLNEYWVYTMDKIEMEGLDMQDKKNVLLYGRSFLKLNFLDKEFDSECLDIYDMVVDPKTDPLKLNTARFLVHQNIFKPLREIVNNERYETKGIEKLKMLMLSEKGLNLSDQNKEALDKKNQRLKDMGVESFGKQFEELLAGADRIISLNEHYTNLWNEKEEKFEKYVIVVAESEIVLLKKPLKEVLGVDFWPFVTWASDLDTSDFWTDGEADIVRTINKVINARISQGTENRTLKSWGMRYYNSAIPGQIGFSPQTFTPEPWGWYPVPGNPNEIIKDINIPGLEDSIPEIQFLIGIIEKATATPSGSKGMTEKKQITLGEVQMVLGKAVERVKGMTKYYRRARKEFAEKWYAIVEAGVPTSAKVKLYKTSFKGNVFEKEVGPNDWKSKAGYKIKVTSTSEQEEEKAAAIQRLSAIKGQFPDNPVLGKIFEKRMLEIGDLTPEEIKEALAYEEQKMKEATMPTMGQNPPTATPVASQPIPRETLELKNKITGLKSLAQATV